MKLIRKITMLLLCVCFMIPSLAMTVFAATPGTITISDTTANVDEVINVNVNVKVDAGVSKLKFTLTYDEDILEFVSAQNTTELSPGELEYNCTIEKNSLYGGYTVPFTFKTLEKGSTKLEIASYEITSSFDITWTTGTAKIVISDGTTTSNTINNGSDEQTPSEDNGEQNVNEENDTIEIKISDTTTITLLDDISDIVLPERYLETTIIADDMGFPAWKDTENEGIYLIYANNNSEKVLYQYDALEDTYQRFLTIEDTSNTEINKEITDKNNDLKAFLSENEEYVIIGSIGIIIIFIIVIIILGTKLYNRNIELDDVYDELDAALGKKNSVKSSSMKYGDDDDDDFELEILDLNDED